MSHTLQLTHDITMCVIVNDVTMTSHDIIRNSPTDMDECGTNNGGCQHMCTNTPGSFECRCNSGFTLESNLLDCAGEHRGWWSFFWWCCVFCGGHNVVAIRFATETASLVHRPPTQPESHTQTSHMGWEQEYFLCLLCVMPSTLTNLLGTHQPTATRLAD